MSRRLQLTVAEAQLLTINRRGKLRSQRLGVHQIAVTVAVAKKFEGRIVSVHEIAKIQFGSVNEFSERRVRKELWRAVNMLLREGIPAYPIYDKKGFGRKIGIKVVTEYNEQDWNALSEYLDAAMARNEITSDKVALIKHVMGRLRKQLSNGK